MKSTATAKQLLQKIAGEAAPCDSKGDCQYCKMKKAMVEENGSRNVTPKGEVLPLWTKSATHRWVRAMKIAAASLQALSEEKCFPPGEGCPLRKAWDRAEALASVQLEEKAFELSIQERSPVFSRGEPDDGL